MLTRIRMFRWILSVIIMCLLFPASAMASTADRRDLETFTDDFMNRTMKEYHVPGTVVAMVQGGKITLIKGYGYADLEHQIPADPYKTVFRLGSIAKSVTATAVMQQYEAGLIDLQEDIKRYIPDLDLKYPEGKPVTVHQLLTHTAGFCEYVYGVGRDQQRQMPLGEAVRSYLPELCRTPGEQVAYSNQGMSLAGYLVETLVQEPYEKVVQDRIFGPLEMKHSTFSLDSSDSLLAKSYSYAAGAYSAIPYSYIHHLPSGALNSTAGDMANFMIAHLQQGGYKGVRILSEQTARLMHSTHYSVHPSMPGMAYGFYERYENGLRLIEHDGGIDGFESYMFLLPTENTGIFVSTNSPGGGKLKEELISEFLDRFYPVHDEMLHTKNPTSAEALRDIEGYYIPNRAHLRGPLNFGQNVSAVHVRVVEDGIITLNKSRYIETEPYLFRSESTGELLYVNREQRLLSLSSIPAMEYEKQTSLLYSPTFHIVILLGLALFYLLQVLVAILSWLVGLLQKKRKPFDGLAALVSLLFIVYFLFILSSAELFINEIPWWAHYAMYSPVLLLSVLAVRLALKLARKQSVTRLQYIFASVTVIFVIYLYSWDFFSL